MDDLKLKVSALSVPKNLPIFDAVARLEAGHRRVILIIDENETLLGLVTDQDIRRAVIARVDFNRPVIEIATQHPVTARISNTKTDILTLMHNRHCYQIPIIDEKQRVVDIWFLEDLIGTTSEKKVAVVMAGGLGSRLRPLTDTTPKPLIDVGGQPILFTILDRLMESGFGKIYLTLNYLGQQIRDAVSTNEKFGDTVHFIDEPDRLGTAGSLSLLPERPTSSFLVMNGDLLTKISFIGMLDFHNYEKNAITMAAKQESFLVPYGVAELEGTRVRKLKEKPTLNLFLNAGIYVIEPHVLTSIDMSKTIDMPDVIEQQLSVGGRVGCFPVHEYWIDVGLPNQLQRAINEYDRTFKMPSSVTDSTRREGKIE